MIGFGLVLASMLGAEAAPPEPPPAVTPAEELTTPAAAGTAATAATETGPESPSPQLSPPPSPPPFPPPLPPPEPAPRRYGDRGTSEIALGLGYSSDAGFLAAGGFRYFLIDGVAPGVDATYVGGGTQFSAFGLVLGVLRLVPIRTNGFALVVSGRGGRVILADHEDGWGLGGSGGVIVFLGSSVGLEIGYEALRLLPDRFCADLLSCVIHGPVFGLRLSL